jgi:endonuclease YncB( thermonuclease family)
VAKAIFTLPSGLKVGRALLGARGDVPGSVRQQTHDGDTVNVDPDGNLGLRFLGVDAPEVSFPLPGSRAFVSVANERWTDFLANPFAAEYGEFDPAIEDELANHVLAGVGPDTGPNHVRHARAAERGLEGQILSDIEALGETAETFRFFCSFATEVIDVYGRLLCYLNREQPDEDEPEPRPKSYNERLLALGLVTPYFIWPNVDPYKRQERLVDAVPEPGSLAPAGSEAEDRRALDEARQAVKEARAAGRGVFAPADPLLVYPFELRFLGRRRPPERWVIDLGAGDDRLRPPQSYHEIVAPEDRLFVPAEYVPLFASNGWRIGDQASA